MDDKEKLTDAEKMLAVMMALGEDDRVKQQQNMNIAANAMHNLYSIELQQIVYDNIKKNNNIYRFSFIVEVFPNAFADGIEGAVLHPVRVNIINDVD